eukprot:CAMPEP_0119300138 /NCGR_PEP_ID=MMETSP1333-20130426/2132_1 /TAXON_ID=418940 /ORGANISM="Scyphosphaera apsteinii, Strain RCC1455" /LENGTH=276 /DNA_ID=CAMNT_0007301805 /DNA_START=332 /DNA_END=1162 /DNA_ORIENTATION=-
MSFSSGVMIYVSLVEVISVANEYFAKTNSAEFAYALATLSFFSGVLVMALVDQIVHQIFERVTQKSKEDHHVLNPASGRGKEVDLSCLHATEEQGLCRADCTLHDDDGAAIAAVAGIIEKRRLLTMAAVVSAAIVLHNIPEGMATYVASFHSVTAGLPLAGAIAIHNIPEGLAVAMPIYHATKSKCRAVALGTLSGMSEPVGAVLASFVANEDSSQGAFGGMFGMTAGMMSYVCVSELLPAAYGEKGVRVGLVTFAFFCGCGVMALSLVVEKFALS